MSDKIKPDHLQRKAVLYIRQSSAYQVSNNLESQKLQYAMQARLRQLGWQEVEIVDDDLGRSLNRPVCIEPEHGRTSAEPLPVCPELTNACEEPSRTRS